ncbi:GNAT family N-acetyltransferase [uncultured Sphaerochaeta sp.]|uniref:GNAT family N-acetyltransferase n=1 Tax=uncultured Sphaerochaeta sp. TaxID=886478 RepID=UPI003748BF6E
MEYIQTNDLTEKQHQEILKLQEICFDFEKLNNSSFLSNELNCKREIPCFFLAYETGTLVAFLTCFIPSFSEAEINGCTHPDYRRQGIFTHLLSLSKAVLIPYGFTKYLLQVEPKAKSALPYIQKLALDRERTEYRLSIAKKDWKVKSHATTKNLTLERVTEKTMEKFASISSIVFEEPTEDSIGFITSIEKNPERSAYLCIKDGILVGVFNMHYEKADTAILYGVGILPQFRQQGLGYQMVSQALALAFSQTDTVFLDVDSNNPKAFSLYTRIGFTVSFQVDYYTLLLA